ncbi:hypothetical protein Ancab_002580, partial [Ancistrocladus abbreviatus]
DVAAAVGPLSGCLLLFLGLILLPVPYRCCFAGDIDDADFVGPPDSAPSAGGVVLSYFLFS